MSSSPARKGFLFTVVICATVAFVLFYWLWRSLEGTDNSIEHAAAAKTSISKIASASSSSPTFQAAVIRGEASAGSETHVLEKTAESVNASSRPRSGVNVAPTSITHRYRPLPAQETETGAAGAERTETPLVRRTQSIELRADSKGCKVCWNSSVQGIAIPRGCVYASHTLTQLRREPFAPVAQLSDGYTEYLDRLDTDAKGRLDAITLIVSADKNSVSSVNHSIVMRLTVDMACPADTNAGG